MKLLLIDDDQIDRMNIKRILGRSGHKLQITEAQTAEEGLKFAQDEVFDIILLDYLLPGVTGLDLLKILRNFTIHSTAIVMLSHSENESTGLKCIEAGAQDFIPKNEVQPSRLIQAIMQAKMRFRMEQELLESHNKLVKMAATDTLTGLANRDSFEIRIRSEISLAEQQENHLALVLLDLNNFKEVNVSMGHPVGDQLLIEIARRLVQSAGVGDLLFRISGNEFAIVVEHPDTSERVRQLVKQIFSALAAQLVIDEVDIVVTASVGISIYPTCAKDAMQLMKGADTALSRAKEMGANQYHFCTD
ncbi:MAG: diguanylate cyclase (GGDEF)-like protein [Phenylobacterium sp.]